MTMTAMLMTFDKKPPKPTARQGMRRLFGNDAFAHGFNWAVQVKIKYTAEDVRAVIERIGTPKDDYDRGFIAGLQ